MSTKLLATADADTFINDSHSVLANFRQGHFSFNETTSVPSGISDPAEPYDGFIEGLTSQDVGAHPNITDAILSVIHSLGDKNGQYYFEIFAQNSVDYSSSLSGVSIDLEASVQHGGYAEGDVLVDIGTVVGSSAGDVIRGSNVTDYPADSVIITVNGTVITSPPFFFTFANPGQNSFFGGAGNDLLEGRGGADSLDGGTGFDFASYESSPARVIVQLGDNTQTAIATGGDATGDTLASIEGLIGSAFDDRLAGNSSDNVIAGGLGNDFIDGEGGTDTADYSRDHFFDLFDGADRVVVQLGLNDANGTGAEFKLFRFGFGQVSTDTLFNIENVTGTAGNDELTGNEKNNVLDGRGGADTLDGGLGNDTLIGGATSADIVSFASHNGLSGEFGRIALGLNGADGSAEYLAVVTVAGHPLPVVVETDVLIQLEHVTGSNLNETITGNEQDNILDGGLGNDTITGGGGKDTASFLTHDSLSGEFGRISLGLNGADGSAEYSALIIVAGHPFPVVAETDVLREIENVTGSNLNETINGNEQDNVLDGRGGIDTINGNAGNDTLIGGDGNDTLNGGANNDTLIGGVGTDILNGGADNDTYDFRGSGLGSDHFFDESGTDRVLINSLNDLVGSPQRVGTDLVVNLTTGSFTVVNHFGGNAIESLVTSDGKTVTLSTSLTGGANPGIIVGGNGDETLDGKGGDDLLFGGRGADTLLGGEGDDLLAGGQGNDRLAGGAGTDTYVFEKSGGADTVTDFEVGVDHLRLDDGLTVKSVSNRDVDHDGAIDAVVNFSNGSVTLLGTGPVNDWHLLV